MLLTACSQGTVLPTMARVTVPSSSRPHPAARAGAAAGPPADGPPAAESQQSRPQIHDVTITIDAEHPGPVVPGDFAGLSFERQALNPGNAGVTGRLFRSANNSLVTLFRNLGVRSLRIGGSTADWLAPAGADGNYALIDSLFAFAAAAGAVKPAQIGNPAGLNLTAYCIGGADGDYVTIINKTQGAEAADAAITILPYGPGAQGAEIMTLASPEPGDATAASATLGGASITGDGPFQGTWSTLPTDPQAGIRVTVSATTAVILRIPIGG